MKHVLVMMAVGLGMAACAPTVPDSAAGVGFGDYKRTQQARQARDVALARPVPVQTQPLGATTVPVQQRPAAPAPAPVRPTTHGAQRDANGVVQASPSNPSPELIGNPSISDENDFDAVGARRSIESDAQRIAQNRAQYQVVATTDLPSRPGETGPNIVAYALKTTNPVGVALYKRSPFKSQKKYARNCAQYTSPDMAQTEFLSRGGPQRDRLGLDPDGDGYACSWNPAPFRKLGG